jgi:hypothetical protein
MCSALCGFAEHAFGLAAVDVQFACYCPLAGTFPVQGAYHLVKARYLWRVRWYSAIYRRGRSCVACMPRTAKLESLTL